MKKDENEKKQIEEECTLEQLYELIVDNESEITFMWSLSDTVIVDFMT